MLDGSLIVYTGQHSVVLPTSALGRAEVDTDGAKLTRARRLWGAVEDRGLPGDLKIGETGSDDRRFELCFQQSTGDSTGPKVDLSFRFLRHFPVYQDVANL